MKQYKRSIVAGKFMPPHKGHLALMDKTVEIAEDHLIVICSTEEDTIDPELRLKWIQAMKPNYNVVLFPSDHLPQNTDAKLEISKMWADAFFDTYGDFDVIVTSEPYGDTFAKAAGIEHFLFDLDRKEYPVSGTMIRENPMKHWKYIPEPIRYYFVKKICVFGPESTGKTTMTRMLGYHYGSLITEELAREWLKDRQPLFEDFKMFGLLQAGSVLYTTMRSENGLVFSDTDAVTTKLFLPEYFPDHLDRDYGETWDFLGDIAKALIYDFYVLLAPTVPWEDDGTRIFGEEDTRWGLYNKYKLYLQVNKIPFVEITSDNWDDRFKEAVYAIDNFIGGQNA